MTRTFGSRSTKNMEGIQPDLRLVLDKALEDSPLDFVVIEGLRTKERQQELVDSGASQRLDSRHITGHAVDLLPIGPNGKPAFDWPLYDQLGPAVKKAAVELGVELDWGGDWKKFKDGPHFELDRAAYPVEEWTTGDKPPAPRTSAAQSSTVQASAVQIVSGAGAGIAAVGALDGHAQIVALAFAGVIVLAALWIMRQRLISWADGDR